MQTKRGLQLAGAFAFLTSPDSLSLSALVSGTPMDLGRTNSSSAGVFWLTGFPGVGYIRGIIQENKRGGNGAVAPWINNHVDN